jgi:hypothetical protein
MSTTIPKNSRTITQLKAELTGCTVYRESDDFRGAPCDPKYAWEALANRLHARLRDNSAGTYTVHVHNNLWYELRRT